MLELDRLGSNMYFHKFEPKKSAQITRAEDFKEVIHMGFENALEKVFQKGKPYFTAEDGFVLSQFSRTFLKLLGLLRSL